MLSFEMSDEQKMLTDQLARFARDAVRAIAHEADEAGSVPPEVIDTAWGFGLVPAQIPEAFGGFGEEHAALTGVLAYEELGWGDLAVALHAMTPALVAIPVLECGAEAQKAALLPGFCEMDFPRATAALLEPAMQFDPNDLKTTATRENDAYVLNGTKAYVPLAADAEQFLIYASEGGQTQGFLVPRGADGLTVGAREKLMGVKALPTYTLTLEGVRVPAADRLGGEAGADFGRLMCYSNLALASLAVGVARGAAEYARDYARERVQFGEPIAHRQAIAFMIAEMFIEIDATRLMVWEAAWKMDQGQDASKECYLARMYADDMVVNVTDRAVQTLGGYGFIREYPVEMWLRNGRGFATFDGLAMV
ncbi:MAG: acyl-CoA dehydrogenase family protein [Anaerolineae bacterium]|nr:acyl-CoA dehydrogenase family protein [Anaerolineae bacterium]